MPIEIKNALVLYPHNQPVFDILSKHNIQVQARPDLTAPDRKDDLLKTVKNFDVIFISGDVKVDAEFLKATAPRLKCIIFQGAGIDHIDVEEATAHNVAVMNCPDSVTVPTAETCCALTLALAKNLTRNTENFQRNGVFDKMTFLGTEVHSKTLGIIGFGRIGKQVAARMAAFGMKILAYGRSLTQEDAGKFGAEAVSLDELYARSDYISLNVPLTNETRNLINLDAFRKCKPGVRLVNTARGPILNQQDALAALDQNLCAGIATDVFDEEPPKSAETWRFVRHDKVIATPHLAGMSVERVKRVVVDSAEQLVKLITGQSVPNCVNPSTLNNIL